MATQHPPSNALSMETLPPISPNGKQSKVTMASALILTALMVVLELIPVTVVVAIMLLGVYAHIVVEELAPPPLPI